MTRSENELRAAYREPPDPAVLTRLRASIEELAEPAAPGRRSRRRWLAPMVAAVAVIAVFATITVLVQSSHHHAATRPGGAVSAALRLWADFPVDASPRPLVLTGPDILSPEGGFAADGDAKIAFISGSFQLKTTLPAAPATVSGLPVMSAALALAQLRSEGEGKQVKQTLSITSVKLGTGEFSTDRGPRSLPAWLFRFAGVTNPAPVLAVPTTDRWPQPGMPTSEGGEGGVSVSRDGSRLTLSFVGAPPGTGPCQAEYTADVSESATAVSISPRELPHPSNGGNDQHVLCDLVGYSRTVTVTLRSPLGNRVVVDSRGVPLPAGK